MRQAWLFLHLVGAAFWLGGMLTLGLVAVIAHRTLQADAFRTLLRRLGRAFAAGALLAWALIGLSGLALAGTRWSGTLEVKTAFAALALAGAAAHALLGRRTSSRLAIAASRALSPIALLATLAVFYLAVRLAEPG